MSFPVSFNQDVVLLSAEVAARRSQPAVAGVLTGCFQPRTETCPDILEDALNALAERHSSLRTTFRASPQMPPLEREVRLQVFTARGLTSPGLYEQAVAPHVPRVRLHRGSLADPEAQRRLLAASTTPFDHAAPPYLRASLLSTGDSSSLLFVSVSSLICDFCSLQVLRRDLALLYRQMAEPETPSLPPVPQFHSFVRWQRTAAYNGRFDAAVEYWRKQGERNEPCRLRPAHLPALSASPAGPNVHRCSIPREETFRLREAAAQCGISMRSLVFALFCAQLSRVTRQRRVAIPVSFRNRVLPEHEGVIGWFANTHLAGLDVPPGTSTLELAEQAEEVFAGADAHQGVPPSFLWSKLGQAPEAGDAGVSFSFFSATGADFVPTEARRFHPIPLPEVLTSRPHAGLAFLGVDTEDGLLLAIHHSPDRFPGRYVAELLRSLQSGLAAAFDIAPVGAVTHG